MDEAFYYKEKSRFDELLNQLNWTEEHLLQEANDIVQCPLDCRHRFPVRSKHLETCQLVKDGFSKDYSKESIEYRREKQLLQQSDISVTPSTLSNILHRSLPIKTDLPLNVEQTTILLTPNERLSLVQFVHKEALRLKIVPDPPSSVMENRSNQSSESNSSQLSNKSAQLRDEKRRRAKYVNRTRRKTFYDNAREMISSQMELLYKHGEKRSKYKHRSPSSSSSSKKKHHRHSKKRRTTPD
ncbi:unnamed protein product [Adineta ricciae]|uniref:CHHC U11-48K-type domain-containing protein n=1 Tax=Adineta ricciae TaxID=249248 RepID=A0A814DPN4_ADIRI|nr:unnamed protein product [Adineta ricciae]CAF1599188.1 unnamed protein product [Adineta ricciae]